MKVKCTKYDLLLLGVHMLKSLGFTLCSNDSRFHIPIEDFSGGCFWVKQMDMGLCLSIWGMRKLP